MKASKLFSTVVFVVLTSLLSFQSASYAQEKDYYSKGSTTVSFEPSAECDGRPVRFTIEWTLTSYLGEPAYNVKTKAEVFGDYVYYKGKRYNFESENSEMLSKIDPQLSDWGIKTMASLGDYDIDLQENSGLVGISIDGLSSKEISTMLKSGNKLHSFRIENCIDFNMSDFANELKKKQDILKTNQQKTEELASNTQTDNSTSNNISQNNTENLYNNVSAAQNTNSSFQPQAANLNKAKSVEYTNKANQLYINGSYDEAQMYWEKALELDPNNQAAKNNIAQLRNIQNSNAQLIAQSHERANNFNAQQQNIQQSSENIANNLVDGSPNAVGQAGVATAKLLAESGADYTESMLGGAGVVALGALLNSGGKKLGLTGENITKEYKNATYVGGFYDGKFDGSMKVTFKNGTKLNGHIVRKPLGVPLYEANIFVPNTCEGKIHCYLQEQKIKSRFPKNYLAAPLNLGLKLYSEINYINGDKYLGKRGGSHPFYEYIFADNKKIIVKNHFHYLISIDAKVIFPNGNISQGSYIDMIRTKKCIYEWKDGSKYDCEYKEGKRYGKLDITFNNGDVFQAKYHDNIFEDGIYHNSKGENISIPLDGLIANNLNSIPQKNLYKILLIVYEDLLNANKIEQVKKVYTTLDNLCKNEDKLIDTELNCFLIERIPFPIITPCFTQNLSKFYKHLDMGYANLNAKDTILAIKHYYSASQLINFIASDFSYSPELRNKLRQIKTICERDYYRIVNTINESNDRTKLINIISSIDYKQSALLIDKSIYKLPEFKALTYNAKWLGGVTYQEYACFLNETGNKKNKFKSEGFRYYKGIILPSIINVTRLRYLSYKEYAEYIEWLTNKTPSRQEYRKIYVY